MDLPNEHDRETLRKLTELVGEIADRLGVTQSKTPVEPSDLPPADAGIFRFGESEAIPPAAEQPVDRQTRSQRLPLPDPRLVRRIIAQRQMRCRYFDSELFADPAWDMLLDLTAARAEHRRVSVTSLCIASGVPPTTALRWIGLLTDAGLIVRNEDASDKRRAFIELTEKGSDSMARYFTEMRQLG